ncbi:MarR family winged helix-turn-helix transcriptional regulator [Virgibacillus siamensis]|uniref:MarR family winged helix-turn-helix transcriptional regulator n=1 Tax=Virgibacillus siamensis TaxID=480071 RepID=UPI0009860CA2|nr:MarR family transcriptional regulator [Virgibacillus siamensis]
MNENDRLITIKKQDPSLKLFVVLSKTYRVMMDQVEKDIQSKGLNLTDFAVLELLYHRGSQPVQKIADKILLASGSISYVVKKLEKKDYLVRESNCRDRRVMLLSITEKGAKLLNSIFPDHWKKIDEIMSGLNMEEKEQAINLVKKLGTSIKEL